MRRRLDLYLAVWSVVVAFVLLGPLAMAGHYLLLRDAVSTPRSYVTDAALGLGGNAARATPQDWLLALGSQWVDGGYLVTGLLWASLAAAGWGFGRAAIAIIEAVGRPAGTPAALAAATVALWNPFVGERLLQGHWSLMAGYAAIGWVIVVALRTDGLRQIGGFAACFAAGGLTPTGAVYALVTAVVCAPRRWAVTLALFVCAAAPWLYPSLVSGDGVRADPASVAVFAARAEPGLGTLGSLLGLGGIWNREAVPSGAPWLWTVFALVLLADGLWILRHCVGRRPLGPVALLALAAIVLPALAATGPGAAALAALVQSVPGSGLLRDGHKWVALAVPLYAVCAAAIVAAVPVAARTAAAIVAVAVPVIVLPGMAWGIGAQLTPVTYPSAWSTIAAAVPADHGAVAVVPVGMFRTFAYGPDAAALDPAPRMLRAPVLQTGELRVGGKSIDRVPGQASAAERALIAGGDQMTARLADLGVGWVLVEAVRIDGREAFPDVALPGLTLAVDTAELRLYRVPTGTAAAHDVTGASTPARVGAWAVHLLWAATGLVGAAIVACAGRRETTKLSG